MGISMFDSTSATLPVPNEAARLHLLQSIAPIMGASAPVRDALEQVLELMRQTLPISRGSITLISPATGEIRIEASCGLKDAERLRGRYARGEGVTGRVIQTGQAMCIRDVADEPLFLNRTGSRDLEHEAIAFLCVPILLAGQAVGALAVDRQPADEATLRADMDLLRIIATLLGHAAFEGQRFMDDRSPSSAPSAADRFPTSSPAMRHVLEQIAHVAPTGTTVFLQGESGTGKEVAARTIHAAGPRASGPFISLNCAALPENLIESEMFGHERGAFTGAGSLRKGRFELADGGTLFLDEVGELTLPVQAKLLRVLQERSFERLGGTQTLHVDVRIIAATNRNLEQMVEEGSYRRDLFYRLNVFPIHLPALRERRDDILPLASRFALRFARANGREDARLSSAVMDMLQRYNWPGNVRELENVMERAVLLLGREDIILPQHLPLSLHGEYRAAQENVPEQCCILPAHTATLPQRIAELERACIVEALTASGGHMGRAAQALGLTERIMGLRMRKYKLRYQTFRQKVEEEKRERV